MKISLWTTPVAWCLLGSAAAQDGTRFAERTPLPHRPPAHTMERAGHPQTVAWWATPGVARSEAGGYVGGGSPRGNRVFAAGPGAAGSTVAGTFGWDFVGLRGRSGRVFLAPSADPSTGSVIGRNYRTDGPVHVPDVTSLRPFRRAVLEKKEAAGERKTNDRH